MMTLAVFYYRYTSEYFTRIPVLKDNSNKYLFQQFAWFAFYIFLDILMLDEKFKNYNNFPRRSSIIKWCSQRLGNLSLESNDVMTSY